MKKLTEIKFIDVVIHVLCGFVLLLPIFYVLTPVLVSCLSHTLNITMADINSIWDNSMSHANTTLFTLFNDTQMLTIVDNTLNAFNIDNDFLANIINYWILTGALCLLFDIIMQTFIWIIKIITPKPKKAD